MIDLEKVVPGDVLYYRGRKCIVKSVNLHRNADMTTEVTGISVKMADGYSEPCICPSGFKHLEAFKEEMEAMNAKVVCVKSGVLSEVFTAGRIYEVVDGKLKVEDMYIPVTPDVSFTCIGDINCHFLFQNARFIEVVE